ncbi:LysR family transcriptional regulator [Pseudomonas huanghezhanensis]|uniref:LysR family transcriptional regulator n=1 Tax=Pseudomonas huanghezhanensis TaxID=3002903 RepID=UPI002286A641|nr:LysR family transcriptional regulator [Pseudomonas sp. BSw22131]
MANNIDQCSLDDLSIFLAVFRENGFRAAAKRLGLSPSTVSERISALESGLGVPLLIRTTRSVVATAAGRELAERMSPLLGEMRAVFEDVASSLQDLRGVLKLNVTGAVMVDILPTLIDRFLARYPQVRIEIMVEDRLVDVTAAGCDAGIRYGEHLAQDTIAVPIGPRSQQLALAAAPSYLASRGTPAHPGELMNHDCICLRYSSGAMVSWDFVKNGETVSIDPPGRLVIGVDGVAAAIDLARSGRGIIATFENWLRPHLQSGDLQPVLNEWWDTFEGPWLYFSSRFMSAPLRAFVDFIEQERG